MNSLDKYAGDVLLAYGLGLVILIAIVAISIFQSRRAKKQLEALE